MSRFDQTRDLRRLPGVALRALGSAGRAVVCAGAADPLVLLAAASLPGDAVPLRPRTMPVTLCELSFPLPYSTAP